MIPEGTYRFPKGFRWGTLCEYPKLSDSGIPEGINSVQISLDMKSIQPKPEVRNEASVEALRTVLPKWTHNGVRPMLSLCGNPADCGIDWEKENAPELFYAYAVKTFDAFKSYVTEWIPISNPILAVQSMKLRGDKAFRCLEHMTRAHTAVFEMISRTQPEGIVGTFSGSSEYPHALQNGMLSLNGRKRKLETVYNTLNFVIFRVSGKVLQNDSIRDLAGLNLPIYLCFEGETDNETLGAALSQIRELIFRSIPIAGVFTRSTPNLLVKSAARNGLYLPELAAYAPSLFHRLWGD